MRRRAEARAVVEDVREMFAPLAHGESPRLGVTWCGADTQHVVREWPSVTCERCIKAALADLNYCERPGREEYLIEQLGRLR